MPRARVKKLPIQMLNFLTALEGDSRVSDGTKSVTYIRPSASPQMSSGFWKPVQIASHSPSGENTCSRLFSRSATTTRPSGSTQIACGLRNAPGPCPSVPQAAIGSPAAVKRCTRALA